MSKITKAQEKIARELLKKHGREKVYVNIQTGHMHFHKNGALLGAGEDEKLLEVVTAEESKPAASKQPDKKPADPKKDAVEIPEGEPTNEWKKPQTQAYMEREGIAFSKKDTEAQLLEKIGKAVAGEKAGTPEEGKEN